MAADAPTAAVKLPLRWAYLGAAVMTRKDDESEAEDRDAASTADEHHLLEGRVAEVRGCEQDEAEDMSSVEEGGGTLALGECRSVLEVGCYFWRGRVPWARPHSVVVLLVVASRSAKSLYLHAAEAAVALDANGPVHNKAAYKVPDRRAASA